MKGPKPLLKLGLHVRVTDVSPDDLDTWTDILDQIPPEYQRQYTRAEAAEMLGVPIATLRTREAAGVMSPDLAGSDGRPRYLLATIVQALRNPPQMGRPRKRWGRRRKEGERA